MIKSIQAQTLIDWEMIIVDDHSTDNTCKIIENYTATDSRIKLYKRFENSGGCRLPRFDAILKSSGKYVCPIDSDDIIESKYLQKMVDAIEKTGADIVTGIMYFFKDKIGDMNRCIPYSNRNGEILTGKDACSLTLGKWDIGCNGLLTRTNVYKSYIENHYQQTFNGPHSDELDNRRLIINVSKIAFTNAAYYYRQVPTGIVLNNSIKSFNGLTNYKELMKFTYDHYKDDLEIKKLMSLQYASELIHKCMNYYKNYGVYSFKERQYIIDILRCTFNDFKQYRKDLNKISYKLATINFFILRKITQLRVQHSTWFRL